MPSLLEMQRDFGAALLDPACAQARMRVYRANAFGNWSAALAGAYPIVRAIVGPAFFELVARDYSQAAPSVSGDLHEYGAQLAAFLEGHAPATDLPYLPDVARMEWLAHRAYYAADAQPFDFSRPTEVRLAPSAALLESGWPLAGIWAAHQEGGDPSTVDLDAGADRVLVHRSGWRVEACSLRPGDFRFLAALQVRRALGPALEAAAAADPAFIARVALAAWVQAGVITQ
jgi:hypothetical protein